MCVCVCVCGREREREGREQSESGAKSIPATGPADCVLCHSKSAAQRVSGKLKGVCTYLCDLILTSSSWHAPCREVCVDV